MKLILAMMAHNEAPMLRKTLPVIAPYFDHCVALDCFSHDDTVELLEYHNFEVVSYIWQNDYSAARNELFDQCRTVAEPGDWVVMLDADEAMYSWDIDVLRQACRLASVDLITLPRWNLMRDGSYYDPRNYPDQQARVLRFGADIEFRNPVHEVAYRKGDHLGMTSTGLHHFLATKLHIYHYGACKPIHDIWLRSHNYRMLQERQPLLTEAPASFYSHPEEAWSYLLQSVGALPFCQSHPLEDVNWNSVYVGMR